MDEEQTKLTRLEADEYSYEMRMYRNCMLEIKSRYLIIKERLAMGCSNQTKRFDFEVICLQFRSILELIYLSSLAANQKVYTEGYEKLKAEWSRYKITKFLKKQNINYYPQPLKLKVTHSSGGPFIDMNPIESKFLTETDLEEIYTICNDYTHPRNPFAEENNYRIWTVFPDWIRKILQLLTVHTITLYNENRKLLTQIDFDKQLGEKDVVMMYLVVEKKTIIGSESEGSK